MGWGDVDSDGDLDLFSAGNLATVQLYRNDGSSGNVPTLTLLNLPLPTLDRGDGTWGDFNGDGALDLLISGATSGSALTRLYQNHGCANLVLMPQPLPAAFAAAEALTHTLTLVNRGPQRRKALRSR